MFKRPHTTFLVSIPVLTTSTSMASDVLVEAESFKDPGGWVLDPQFLDTMGSPYLLAHGLGKPVENATTEIEFPESGQYVVWVRTKNWVPKWSPGQFKLLVDGKELQPVFGTGQDDWAWHRGGTIDVTKPRVRLELNDLTGFDGRCDAIFFTTRQKFIPPNQPGPSMQKWRKSLLGLPTVPPSAGHFDVVVVGGETGRCSRSQSHGLRVEAGLQCGEEACQFEEL